MFTNITLIVSQDLYVLTSLRVLTFLTYAYVRPKTPTHIPLQPLFIPISNLFYFILYLNIFILTTYSYMYVAFFNYYPV